MLRLSIAFLPLLAACATESVNPDSPIQTLPHGRWDGSVEWHNVPDVNNSGTQNHTVVLLSCNDGVQFFYRESPGLYSRTPVLTVARYDDTFVMHAMDKQSKSDGWVEAQVVTLAHKNPEEWAVALSRSVLNRAAGPDSPFRH